MYNKIGIIFNGSKSKRKLKQYIHYLQKENNYTIEVFTTKSSDEIAQKTNMAVVSGCELIVSAGGDGTLLYVMNALISYPQIPLLTLPLGTGNDFSKMLGICTIKDAVAATQKQNVHKVDILVSCFLNHNGEPEKLYFCSSAGMGIFANIFRQEKYKAIRVLRKIFGNLMNYVCTLWCIFTTKNIKCKVTFGDQQHELYLKLFEVNKVRESGGLALTPRAQVDNAILDLWMISNAQIIHLLKIIFKAIHQKHIGDSHVDYFCDIETHNRFGLHNLKDIRLEIPEPFPFHLHGEFIGHSPEYFKIASNKLNFLSNLTST